MSYWDLRAFDFFHYVQVNMDKGGKGSSPGKHEPRLEPRLPLLWFTYYRALAKTRRTANHHKMEQLDKEPDSIWT